MSGVSGYRGASFGWWGPPPPPPSFLSPPFPSKGFWTLSWGWVLLDAPEKGFGLLHLGMPLPQHHNRNDPQPGMGFPAQRSLWRMDLGPLPPSCVACTGVTGIDPPVTPPSYGEGIWSPQLEVGPQHCDPLEKGCVGPQQGMPSSPHPPTHPIILWRRDMATPMRSGPPPKHCDPLEKGPGDSSWSWASPALQSFGEGVSFPPQQHGTALRAEGYGGPQLGLGLHCTVIL